MVLKSEKTESINALIQELDESGINFRRMSSNMLKVQEHFRTEMILARVYLSQKGHFISFK